MKKLFIACLMPMSVIASDMNANFYSTDDDTNESYFALGINITQNVTTELLLNSSRGGGYSLYYHQNGFQVGAMFISENEYNADNIRDQSDFFAPFIGYNYKYLSARLMRYNIDHEYNWQTYDANTWERTDHYESTSESKTVAWIGATIKF